MTDSNKMTEPTNNIPDKDYRGLDKILSERQLEAVLLYHAQGHNQVRVGEMMKVTQGRVSQLLKEASQILVTNGLKPPVREKYQNTRHSVLPVDTSKF